MTAPKTLLELSGADLNPPKLSDACLVLIDIQNEYRSGPLALPDAEPAIAVAAKLLARARQSGAAIFHIAHKGRAGSLFDREAERGAIVSSLTPLANEAVIEKALPNAFAGTDLQAKLAATGRTNIVLAGFMTHMCISSTARAALDLGLRTTIAADACATRDLPDGRGGALSARTIHEVALAELSDRFAIIAQGEALT
ncbi:cysteine hydrolase family protein [Bradyrhizobium betae]|uniref:Cysteine hydrolase n=1 Tax=Bradyrhizobium betae TaxID=244734 RepID=A0A5P6PDI1_9BRAD|nr:cysteine hydrolase family protein [Bradyrhizobium betae]MCS3729862.1 nicotinamidase-related amidase [Bradyrhizobium betae]QFI75934.1 cysteine hydrolase [Bradyrhizobium betae]